MGINRRPAASTRRSHGRDHMQRSRFRALAAIVATALATILAAGPAAANESVTFADAHVITNTYTCGVVEYTVGSFEGRAYFDSDGIWLKDIIQFRYEASFTDPASGETIEFRTRQVVTATPETLTLLGQGVFIKPAGHGAVLLDVGRLVVDPADWSVLFASDKVLDFEDPTTGDTIDAAVCSLF